MGAIKSQELSGLKLVSLTGVSTSGDKAKAIADLNAVKTNPTVNLDNTQAGNILAVLGDADTTIPDGDEFSSVRAMANEWNADDATPEQKATAENNLINYVNTDKEKNIPTVLTALGEAVPKDRPATEETKAPESKKVELSEEQKAKVKAALSQLGTVVGSTWDGIVRGFQAAAEPASPKSTASPATQESIKKADGNPLTQTDISKGTTIDTNVKKVGDDLFIQTQNNQAVRVSKDGVLSGIKTNAKSEFVTVDGKEERTLQDGESVDIALTTETKTFEDGDDGSFDKAIPTKILRVEKHSDGLHYGVFELKDGKYVLTEGKHSSVKPSENFETNQPLRYLHATDGNIYNEDGITKWVGPSPSTVGAADAPPQYSSLASVLNNLTDIEKQKQLRKAGKTQKERQEEDMLMAAASMIGGQGGQASGGIGGGLGLQMGADSFGNFNVGVGIQGTNFGAGIQFGGGPNNGFGGPGFPGFGNGGVVNLEEMLTVVFAILEQQERKRIVGYLKDMYKKSSAMGAVTSNQVKDRPGILNQMNTETSISQAFLQNSMGKRQNMLETLYGIIRNTHESKRRSIQNIA